MNFDYKDLVEKRIKRIQSLVGYSDKYRHYTLDEDWAKRKVALLLSTGEAKLKEMLQKVEELGYQVYSYKVTPIGSLLIRARKEGKELGGWVDPFGQLKLGLKGTKTPALKISYWRDKLHVKETFLLALLIDSGFRKKPTDLK